MSSTEQKNVTQPFISHCFTYGILPTILTAAFDNYSLDTNEEPFQGLGETPNLGRRLRNSKDPATEAKLLFPVLNSAKQFTRSSAYLLALCDRYTVRFGNSAVLRFAAGILDNTWRIRFTETHAIKHARRHTSKLFSMLGPAAYGNASRAASNANKLELRGECLRLRIAADTIDFLLSSNRSGKHGLKARRWCTKARNTTGLRTGYTRSADAIRAYKEFDYDRLRAVGDLPGYSSNLFVTPKRGTHDISIQRYGSHTYIRLTNRDVVRREANMDPSLRSELPLRRRTAPIGELFCFSQRDLEDLRFLLQAGSAIRGYHSRRSFDVLRGGQRFQFGQLADHMWDHYKQIMKECGESFDLRNKLGVYFDVLQWRYLAWRSGDEFYNHSYIMSQKIESKGLSRLSSQDLLLASLKNAKMDVAVDLLGMYKASIYPEVDPFKVVVDQKKLHYSRHNTDWEPESPEALRFAQTKSYMWYFGVRVIYNRLHFWPGKIRDGVDPKEWHKTYKQNGIPGDRWEEAHDIDLTGAIPVVDISDEQYMRQQDSACAPPHPHQYQSMERLRKAPRHHKRKLLYAIQEPVLPSLPESVQYLNRIGRLLPDGYIQPISYSLPFSTDIVTGSRCERQKDAPRPFYAASPPWGCILSYFDGITRDFLSNVPQSMLGKSTKQKYTDIASTSRHEDLNTQSFYMSDDKAKYSPRMDPQSQQLPADFFSELFDIPAIKACGPIMYHNQLYYRVCGHLVSYNSNGTDREGMRGASNTWLEIVAQGLATRLARDKGITFGKSIFLSFIDDGLRKFSVIKKDKTEEQVQSAVRLVIDEVIFGLRVLGRELSWDKTFISRKLFVILNELMFDGAHFSSGLKSFCTAGDIELKPVMSANDYEQLYFGKMRGAHSVGTSLDLCHFMYIFETLISHFKLGVNLQDNHMVGNLEYRLFCLTPYALGGGGIRSLSQLESTEVASATKEGIGNLVRMGKALPMLSYCVDHIIRQPIEPLHPVDFMREPEQIHVTGPRLKSQRMAAELRKRLRNIAGNEMSKAYIDQDAKGIALLEKLGKALMKTQDVSAEDVRLLYATTPVAFIDEFIQKLASSATLSSILEPSVISAIRRAVRRDIITSVNTFRDRCDFMTLFFGVQGDLLLLSNLSELMH